MASSKLYIQEENILKLILEFLASRKLYKAARALEKESHVVNCPYSENVTFLRELILDGDWEAVQQFAQPLEEIKDFDSRKFHFLVAKQKYLEILYERCEGAIKDEAVATEDLLTCLNLLRKYCKSKDEYNRLYWYLSMPSFRDQPEFVGWSADTSRMLLFEEMVGLLKPFLPMDEERNPKATNFATNDRLFNLLIKGLLYEKCIEFCQKRAMHKVSESDLCLTNIITDMFQDQSVKSSGNFYSWLHSLGPECFVIAFEELNIDVEVKKQKWKRATAEMENNSLSRSLTIELHSPGKGLLPRPKKDERKRLSDWQGHGHPYRNFDMRDVSQSWADFNYMVANDERQSAAARVNGDGALAEVPLAEVSLDGQTRPKSVHSPRKMRKNQEDAVLQTLEKHKKRHQEIHQQLAEMTLSVGLALENHKDEEMTGEELPVLNGIAPAEFIPNMDAFRKNKESLRYLNERKELPGDTQRISPGYALNDVSVKGKLESETRLKQSAGLNDKPSVVAQSKASGRPTRITIPEENYVTSDSSKSEITPASVTLPKTPLYNVLPPGFVKLTDGSGAFNTSTPKSCRQTHMTPPPPASPVTSEPHTGKDQVPLRQSHQGAMIHQKPMTNQDEMNLPESERKSVMATLGQTPKTTAATTKHTAFRRSLVNDINKEKNKVPVGDDAFVNSAAKNAVGNVGSKALLPEEMNFKKVAELSDTRVIRSVAFHPSGNYIAVGTNSKTLKLCSVRNLVQNDRSHQAVSEPEVVFTKTPIHIGSVYCIAFSTKGDIIATGSNDKSIKVLRFDEDNVQNLQDEMELAIHSATVRDLTFVNLGGSLPLLASGGAGGGQIILSDCWTGQTVSTLKGHSGNIMTLFAGSQTNLLCSGSADRSVRLWDIRVPKCVDVMATSSCVASVCLNFRTEPELLVSAHENGQCILYDINARKQVSRFHPHSMDCRSVRFSPDSSYVLTGSYDGTIAMTPVRYNCTDNDMLMPPRIVATHRDKVIQCRWHPSQYIFLSSSADRTVALWQRS